MNADTMLKSLWRKTLRDQKRALIGWSIAFATLGLMMTAIFPSIAEQGEQLAELAKTYPEGMQAVFGDFADIATPAGFLRAELFTLMYPLMLLVYVIGRGSDLIAGEEERGVLDILLSHPVSRRRVLLEKAAALGLSTLALTVVSWVALAGGALLFGMDISPLRLGAALFMLSLLGLFFGALALAMGATRGRRGWAVAMASTVAVAGYLLTVISRIITDIEVVRYASPFYYYDGADPLVHALNPGHVAVLVALIAGLIAFAAWRFDQRDLGV